jgi:hypothetical protein
MFPEAGIAGAWAEFKRCPAQSRNQAQRQSEGADAIELAGMQKRVWSLGNAEFIRSRCVLRLMTDVVEKVGGTLPTRNNRMAHDGFLNLSCAFDACFESIIAQSTPSNLFSTASTRFGHSPTH